MAWESFRYGVVASALSADPRQAVVLAREAGFAGLAFDAVSGSVNLTELSGTGAREFRQVLAGQNQQLISLRVDLGIKGLGPGADLDRLLWQFKKVMQAAHALAAPLVCVETGPLPEPVIAPLAKPVITAETAGKILIPGMDILAGAAVDTPPPEPTAVELAAMHHVDTAMVELAAMADQMSVIIAFRSELSSMAALQRALSAARCSWFGVDLDPVSILRDNWSLDEVFAQLGPLTRHVRGRDAAVGFDRRTKPASIGRGDTQWDHLLSNLQGSDFRGYITFDPLELPDRKAAAIAGLKYLRLHEQE